MTNSTSDKTTYKQRREAVKSEQEAMTRKEIHEQMKEKFEHTVDLENLPTKVYEHNWVDRGAKLSCETKTHPNHQAWKR